MTEQNTGTGRAEQDEAVDDQGTNQAEGRALIKSLRDKGFDSSDEQLAIALGRPVEEIKALTDGNDPVDDDIIMKVRGIAKERGIEI